MRYKPLGSTGLHVSKISLGTVELGIDYGFPGTDQYQKPDEAQAIRLLHRSVDLGINLFDTHRDYGVSEQLIGRAMVQMTERPYIASKVTLPPDPGYTGVFPPPSGSRLEPARHAARHSRVDRGQPHGGACRYHRSDAGSQHDHGVS